MKKTVTNIIIVIILLSTSMVKAASKRNDDKLYLDIGMVAIGLYLMIDGAKPKKRILHPIRLGAGESMLLDTNTGDIISINNCPIPKRKSDFERFIGTGCLIFGMMQIGYHLTD